MLRLTLLLTLIVGGASVATTLTADSVVSSVVDASEASTVLDQASRFTIDGFQGAADILQQADVIDHLGAEVVGPRMATLDADRPVAIILLEMNGNASDWCRRLAATPSNVRPEEYTLVVRRPWWAELLGRGCREDAPAPAAILIALEPEAIEGRRLAIVDEFDRRLLVATCTERVGAPVCSTEQSD